MQKPPAPSSSGARIALSATGSPLDGVLSKWVVVRQRREEPGLRSAQRVLLSMGCWVQITPSTHNPGSVGQPRRRARRWGQRVGFGTRSQPSVSPPPPTSFVG